MSKYVLWLHYGFSLIIVNTACLYFVYENWLCTKMQHKSVSSCGQQVMHFTLKATLITNLTWTHEQVSSTSKMSKKISAETYIQTNVEE